MAIQNMPITYTYNFDNVVGRLDLNEEIEEKLARGEEFVLSAYVRETKGVREVVGLTLMPIDLVARAAYRG